MVSILGGLSEGYRPLDKFFYEHKLTIQPLDSGGQGSRILGQWKFECRLNESYELWKSQSIFENGHITIIPQIHSGSHKGKHIVVITNNNEVTRLGNSQDTSKNTRGPEKMIFKSPKDHQK